MPGGWWTASSTSDIRPPLLLTPRPQRRAREVARCSSSSSPTGGAGSLHRYERRARTTAAAATADRFQSIDARRPEAEPARWKRRSAARRASHRGVAFAAVDATAKLECILGPNWPTLSVKQVEERAGGTAAGLELRLGGRSLDAGTSGVDPRRRTSTERPRSAE
jgi:hypothetical protein